MNTFKNMYRIGYKKPNNCVVFVVYTGGNTEEEAKASTLQSAVQFHNKYNNNKITEQDLQIVECHFTGDYKTVLKDLAS